MAQMVLTIVGNAIGGPIGGAIGSALGGAIDRELFGPKNNAPAVGDLSAPKIEYGSEIPRLAGTCVTAGALGWMSENRATEVEAGGKGGSGEVVGYTYAADMILVLGQHDQEAVWKAVAITRVWRNGDLVYSARTGADPETYAASDGTTAWDSIELLDGGPTQMPPDVYESAVGTADAIGWRGRNCMLLRNARFGSSTVPPVYKVEVITEGTEDTAARPPEVVGTVSGAGYSPTLPAAESGDIIILLVHYHGTLAMTTSAFTITDHQTTSSIGSRLAVVGRVADGTSADLETGFTVTGGTMVTGPAWAGIVVRGNDSDPHFPGVGTMRAWRNSLDPLELTHSTGTHQIAVTAAWLDTFVNDVATIDGVPNGYTAFGSSEWVWEHPYNGGTDAYARAKMGYKIITGNTDDPDAFTATNGGGATTLLMMVNAVSATPIWEPGTVDLADLVSANCRRAGIPAALLDVTDLVGIPVRGFPSAAGTRAALEQLAQVFRFGAVCDDKLRFVRRGGSSLATLAYADAGAGFDQPAEEPVEITWGNDDEVPRRLSLTYVNINADHDAGSVIGDRGTGNMARMPTAQVGVVMTPTEAMQVAEAWALDGRYAATPIKAAFTEKHGHRQPTDVLTLTDREGITYRSRIAAESWTLGVHAYDFALDDASIWTQSGVTTDNTTPTINVPLPATPEVILLDIPILRDADDGYGLYACVTAAGNFNGCDVRRSRDNGTTYSVVGALANRAIAGSATALGASTTWGWDDVSTVTLTLSAGAGGVPASATKAAIEADASLNVAAIGVHGRWEIVRFATATLLSPGVYLLSGFLRGQFGTEHNRANHASGDTFVLLRTTGMIRIVGEAGDVGVARKYKAVPQLGSEAAVSAVEFTTGEQGLTCYAPVDLRIDENDALAFNRRTRFGTPTIAGVQPPLGESIEQYEVEIYSGVTLVEGPITVTASPYAPVTTLAGKTAKVWQRNSSIGRGHQAEKAL